ncbi:hypothetical protein X755_16120 [Mesorhizobium sp. LNJC405B00]|nr:hypothetical protein X755_16120 [Mesorhizobium sp. LNJC405B00]
MPLEFPLWFGHVTRIQQAVRSLIFRQVDIPGKRVKGGSLDLRRAVAQMLPHLPFIS